MKKFITKEDKAALSAARKVLKKVTARCQDLQSVRDSNDARWPKASEELYGLLDEIEAAGLDVENLKDYGVFLRWEKVPAK